MKMGDTDFCHDLFKLFGYESEMAIESIKRRNTEKRTIFLSTFLANIIEIVGEKFAEFFHVPLKGVRKDIDLFRNVFEHESSKSFHF